MEHLSLLIQQKSDILDIDGDNENSDSCISFKPNQKVAPYLIYIEDELLKESSLSGYFRRLFLSYSKKPQHEREQIIFKNIKDSIDRAIDENKKVYLIKTGKNNQYVKSNKLSPYKIVASNEELHNYFLCEDENGHVRSYRLSRIDEIIITKEQASIRKENINVYNRMIKYGPQYNFKNEETTIEVLLTKKGIEKFQSFYVYRPTPIKMENNHYFFDCSIQQIQQYFMRFGKDAFVIRPLFLRRLMQKNIREALNVYSMNAKEASQYFSEEIDLNEDAE